MPFYEVEVEKRQLLWVDLWVEEGDDPDIEARNVVGPYMNVTGEASEEYEILAVTEKAEA